MSAACRKSRVGGFSASIISHKYNISTCLFRFRIKLLILLLTYDFLSGRKPQLQYLNL